MNQLKLDNCVFYDIFPVDSMNSKIKKNHTQKEHTLHNKLSERQLIVHCNAFILTLRNASVSYSFFNQQHAEYFFMTIAFMQLSDKQGGSEKQMLRKKRLNLFSLT